MLCRKDRKKEMVVVMLIRYDCVTKASCQVGIVLIHLAGSAHLQSKDSNDGQEGSAEAGPGLSSTGGDDGGLGSRGHEGSCALGNTRLAGGAAGGVDGSLATWGTGGTRRWGDSSGSLDGRGRVARDGHNTNLGGRGGSVGCQSHLGHGEDG